MKPRVLWVEDSARFELSNLTGPVYFSGKYDFQQAENVTTAISFLKTKVYDVLIVDIRLPPGVDPFWLDLYQKMENGGGEKLGIHFLSWLLARDDTYSQEPPAWVNPGLIAVFTVESFPEIKDKLAELSIKTFQHKTAGLPDTILVDLIDKILALNSSKK